LAQQQKYWVNSEADEQYGQREKVRELLLCALSASAAGETAAVNPTPRMVQRLRTEQQQYQRQQQRGHDYQQLQQQNRDLQDQLHEVLYLLFPPLNEDMDVEDIQVRNETYSVLCSGVRAVPIALSYGPRVQFQSVGCGCLMLTVSLHPVSTADVLPLLTHSIGLSTSGAGDKGGMSRQRFRL
jgi:hypothetical protein